MFRQCPGTNTVVEVAYDDDGQILDAEVVGNYDMQIPQTLIDLYQSGLAHQPESVSSFFDIHSRQYTMIQDEAKDNGDPFLVSQFRMLDSVILHDTIEPIEGLIVDTKNGGIGFRHHTIPSNVGQGAQWDEDILFIEPMTSCVNTNLTLEFRIPKDGTLSRSDLSNVTLIDNGGFVNLNQEFPRMNRHDNQVNPKLELRAYRSAWLVNTFAMLIMNVTRPNPDAFGYLKSELGQRFPLAEGSTTGSADSIVVDDSFANLVSPDTNTISNSSFDTGLYQNPFDITADNFTAITTLCQGAGGADVANETNIHVECGLVFTAARLESGGDTLIFTPGDVYRQDVYSCASVNKASIKTVSFRYNATFGSSLKAVSIVDVVPKAYESNDSFPLWGIESPKPTFDLAEITQLWGLISPDSPLASSPNVSTIRAPQLYLPGYSLVGDLVPGIPSYQYIPGASGPTDALAAVYASTASGVSAFDWSGKSNLALYQKWQELSRNETNVANMLGLIWTDAAANIMTGSRGWDSISTRPGNLSNRQNQSDNGGSESERLVPVKVFRLRVRYHWLYAIPALMTIVMFLSILCLATCCMFFRSGPRRVRYYLDHLSAGRLLADQQHPGGSIKLAGTKEWIRSVGRERVNLEQLQMRAGQTQGSSPPVGRPEKGDAIAFVGTMPGNNSIPLTPLNADGRQHGNGYMKMHEDYVVAPYARR